MRRAMNIRPAAGSRMLLAILPFLLLAAVYVLGSAERRAENPNDKLLPPFSEMAATATRLATEADRRTGEITLAADTQSSLQRLALGLGFATVSGLVVGVALGVLPVANAGGGALVAVISMIPPMAILPILFIIFGLGELSKVILIVIGVAPPIVRDIAMTVQAIPTEQLVKAQTLGASTWTTIVRVVLPQVTPRLIELVRLQIGPAFLFLIAAEAIASDSGLGYRIFLVRRYLAMDVILPYVAWITLIAFVTDLLLAKLSRSVFPWAYAAERR